jgi:hypothetical protein
MRKTVEIVRRVVSIVLLLVACIGKTQAQTYPVQVNTQLQAPYSPFLTDYTEIGAQRLIVNFRLNDPTLTEYRGKLRLTIEGVGITIRTKQNFIPQQPLVLQGGGIPLMLYGEDLEEYFNPNNLDFAGLSKNQYEKGAKLPEGVYRFTVEVLDYNRNTVVSNKGTAIAWIILNDPVLLNLPRNESKAAILDPTNIAFTWTPRHTGSPNSAFTTEYIFKLVEIWPASRNPYDAFLSQQPLYETTTSSTQIVYGPAEPALIPGRKYAWQVQAKDTEGRDLFKNEGKSEVYVFQFGDEIGIPQNFRKDGGNSSVLNLRWEPAPDGAIPQQYRVRYRKKSDRDRGVWYESVTPQLWNAIPDLQRDTEYEMQIRAEAAPQYSEYSPSATFKTSAADPVLYECGKEDVPVPVSTSSVLMGLPPGTMLTAAGHKIKVIQAIGSNGDFTGEGWMYLSYLKGAGVRITFSGQINNDYEFTNLAFETVYNKGSVMAQAVDDANNIGNDTNEFFDKKDSAAIVKPDYTVPGTIDNIYVKNDGKIIVVDTEGNESTFEPKKDEKTGNTKETVIADATGNSYTVGADGKVTKNAGTSTGNPAVAQYSVKEKIIVLILEQFQDEIKAWLSTNEKGGEEDDEILLAAELPSCFPRDAGILKPINDNVIPHYKDNPKELITIIEKEEANKQLLDKIEKQFANGTPNLADLSQEDNVNARDNTCEAIMESLNTMDEKTIASLIDYDKLIAWLIENKGKTVAYDFSEFLSKSIYEKITGNGIVHKIPVDKLFYGTVNGERKAFNLKGELSTEKGQVNLDANSGKIQSAIKILPTEDKIQFTLRYKFSDRNTPAITLETNHSDEMEYLFLEQNIVYKDWYKSKVTSDFKQTISNSLKDCNTLDYIYENIPQFVADSFTDEDKWTHLQSMATCRVDRIGTNEYKAILKLVSNISAAYIKQQVDENPSFWMLDIYDRLGKSEKIEFTVAVTKKLNEVWAGDETLQYAYAEESVVYDSPYPSLMVVSCFNLSGKKLEFSTKEFYKCGDKYSTLPCSSLGEPTGMPDNCSHALTLTGSQPIALYISDQFIVVPAFIAGEIVAQAAHDSYMAAAAFYSSVLLPNAILKPATLSKWSRFLGTVSKQAAEQGIAINYEKLAVHEGVNLTNFAAKMSDQYIDVVVHFSDGKFKALIEEGGAFVEKALDAEQLATMIGHLPADKSLRLLSCNDIATAKQLSQQLPARTLYASDGWVELYDDGIILAEHNFKKLVNGEELGAGVSMNGTSKSTNTPIRLGKTVVSATDNFAGFKYISELPDNVLSNISNKGWIDDILTELNSDLADEAFRLKVTNDVDVIDAWGILRNTPYRTNSRYLNYVSTLRNEAKLGSSIRKDYRKTFFEAFPELKDGDYVIHHAIEQQVLKNLPGIVTESEIHSLLNLRGIPKSINSEVHLRRIRVEWDDFYLENPNPTKEQLLQKAKEIDDLLGVQFYPPVR